MIDGGVVCNSPSMYAYFHARFILNEQRPIKILSLGTGNPPADPKTEKKEKAEETKIAALGALANFDAIMNFESLTADSILENTLKQENYVRANKNMKENY